MNTNEALSMTHYVHKKGQVQMANVSPGEQSIGILRAQPNNMEWNLAYVILEQLCII